MMKRLSIAFLALVATDLALLTGIGLTTGWRMPLVVSSITGIVGLIAIGCAAARLGKLLAANEDGNIFFRERPTTYTWVLLVAGILLLLPGLISDVLGLVLLIPPVGRRAAGLMLRLLDE
jgi:UPF0716 protein FxsA